MNCIAIIQARMSSTRLPGKVLEDINGISLLNHIYLRLSNCLNVDKIVVATSIEKSDDILVEHCLRHNIEVFRGSLDNVLSRFISIIEMFQPKLIARITGDCPLIYPDFIDFQIDCLNKSNSDAIYIEREPEIFCGQGVFSSKALKIIFNESINPRDLEHVGSYFFTENPNRFEWIKLMIPEEYRNFKYRLTVDELDDLLFIRNIYDNLWDGSPIPFRKVLNYLKDNRHKLEINNNVVDSSSNKEIKDKKEIFKPIFKETFHWDDLNLKSK